MFRPAGRPVSRRLAGDEALAELAGRYFVSHGPATLADFVWWSGLKVADARRGLDAMESRLAGADVHGTKYWMRADAADLARPSAGFLLPAFDEYFLGYADRGAVVDTVHAGKVVPGNNGIFRPMLVLDGKIVGTWKRVAKKGATSVVASPFAKLSKSKLGAFSLVTKRYGTFLGGGAGLAISPDA